MQISTDAAVWSQKKFGSAELNDQRRTKRLVRVAADLANSFGSSLAAASDDDEAGLEGAYRFVRNPYFQAEQILEAGFRATVVNAAQCGTLLAVEDTTTTNYEHSLCDELGEGGAPERAKTRGFPVHSVLMGYAGSSHTISLAGQR